MFKRRRSTVSNGSSVVRSARSFAKRAKGARMSGRTGYANVLRTTVARLNRIDKTIETKESNVSLANVQLPHNNVYLWNQNPFNMGYGTGDPMSGAGMRIGDHVAIKGLKTKFFIECALARSKVYFRIMLLRGAKAETFTRATIFKGGSGNKMLDDVNTERFTIVAQKIVTCTGTNPTAGSAGITGVPNTETTAGMTGNKIVKFWIPGRKFGRNGAIQFENASDQVKFFDYRWVIVAYDWYGTPQDANNVGFLNEAMQRVYFKDA